jgi:hypothetical protein
LPSISVTYGPAHGDNEDDLPSAVAVVTINISLRGKLLHRINLCALHSGSGAFLAYSVHH